MPVDINLIAENLSELLVNSINMTTVFYDLFINPEPLDITLKQYDDNNQIINVTIPNRAKDRRIALTGEGAPEDVVVANVGAIYVDITTDLVYFKAKGSGSTGWTAALTKESIKEALNDFVPVTRTINNKPLITDIFLNAKDVGALDTKTPYGKSLSVVGSELSLKDQTGKIISTVPIADGGADIDLSNLSEYGEKKLNVSKGYRSGEVNSDRKMFNQLVDMRHSTFDKSKFEVVGTPTITDDGIASGFSSSDFIRIQGVNLSKPFIIYFEEGINKQTAGFYSKSLMAQPQGLDKCYLVTMIDGHFEALIGNLDYKNNNRIFYKLSWDGEIYKLEYRGDITHTSWTLVQKKISNKPTDNANNADIELGWTKNGAFGSQGNYDLKQFSISVNGEEVFSGNKTGIDIIKPDNFDKVGNPTISRTGIISNFSLNDYLTFGFPDFDSTRKYTIEVKYTPEKLGNDKYLLAMYFQDISISVSRNSVRGFVVDDTYSTTALTYSYSEDTKYVNLRLVIDYPNKVFTLYGSTNGDKLAEVSSAALGTNLLHGTGASSLGKFAQYSYFSGSVDLNSFRIYIDSDLIYQPCLKIPYTKAKTGSKVVDSQYRDRVQDVSEQFGKALYYTLDENNKSTTLPMGELYGFIEDSGSGNNGSGHYLGEWIMSTISNNVIPEGCIKPSGLEIFNADQSIFSDLWNWALTPSEDWGTPGNPKTYLDTCSYTEYQNALRDTGACTKWAVDYSVKKFRAPYVPAGYYVRTSNKDGSITREGLSVSKDPSSNSVPAQWFIYVANAEIGDFAINWNKMLGLATDISNKADKNLSNLTPTGEAHFANPSLSNLNSTGNKVISDKEDKSNKVTSLTASSTNTQYPSAKAVYDNINSVQNKFSGKANTNLDNLDVTGQAKFNAKANTGLDNLSASGEAHFANPSLSNLNSIGNKIISDKEDKSNKVTSLTASSTNTQYPSAKAVYDNILTVQGDLPGKASIDLNNLSTTGQAKFNAKANTSLNNLDSTGEAHFANSSLSNLNDAGKKIINNKEDKSNKVTSLSTSSTDTQYPSAKAVYSNLTGINNKLNSKANVDLDNLSQAGLKVIKDNGGHYSDAYHMYMTGEVTNDERGYNQLVDMKRSTFDKSKFTVVGSPTITDDGIASGFSNTSYIKVENLGINSNVIDFKIGFIVPTLGKECKLLLLQADTTNNTRMIIGASTNFSLYSDSGALTSPIKVPSDWVGDIVIAKISMQTNGNTVFLSNITKGVVLNSTSNKIYNLSFNRVVIGLQNQIFTPIDLKQFSISVDGKEVFNGNKTGIDIIKPDNFTKVGNPVISDDGVASGFSDSSCIRTIKSNLLQNKDWDIEGRFIYRASTRGYQVIFSMGRFLAFGSLTILEGNSINFWAKVGTDTDGSDEQRRIIYNYSFKENDIIDFRISFTNLSTYYLYLNINNKGEFLVGSWTPNFANKQLIDINNTSSYITLGKSADNNRYFEGSIDLNAFKIYVDGNLVYQPMLRIPYTESKTGSKIVDSIYRDRVTDVFEQTGKALYYTLDETNKNLTLPAGEIYGMLGEGGVGNPDNVTIKVNDEKQLQAIGTLEKNKQLAKYDWIGTLDEYHKQNIETTHPEWLCYITDDVEGGESVYTKSEVNALLNNTPRTGHYIGEWVLGTTATNVIPEGCIKPDGFEQLDAPNSMFADLWNNCLIPTENFGGQSYLDTCTYEEYFKSVSEYGACAKWAVDVAGKKFKVPLVPDGYFMEQGEGSIKKPGLPNITGEIPKVCTGSHNIGMSGAFRGTGNGQTGYSWAHDYPEYSERASFDASRSNPIYGASNTVQPKSIGVRWFIYIANTEIGDFAVNWNKMQNEMKVLGVKNTFGFREPDFIKANKKTVTIKKGTVIKLPSGQFFDTPTDSNFDISNILDTGTVVNGKDYYFYMNNDRRIIASLNEIAPTGIAKENVVKIGGAHTLCVGVTAGNAPVLPANSFWSAHPYIGYNAGDFMPNSSWTPAFHSSALTGNKGQVLINYGNYKFWCDIYLMSGTGKASGSTYYGTITSNRQFISLEQDLLFQGKDLPDLHQFMLLSEGSNQRTNIAGNAIPADKKCGGYLDTAGKRMISGFGVECACGYLWQLGNPVAAQGSAGWGNYTDTARGEHHGTPAVFGLGGDCGNGSHCGSWCTDCSVVRTYAHETSGARGVSSHIEAVNS